MTDKEVFSRIDGMFSGDTVSLEVGTIEWQAIKRYCGLAPDGRPPTQKGWHFWAFELEEEDGEWILCMLGPKMQAASFSVPKTSLRVEIIKQFLADMQSVHSAGGKPHE